jgi:hypothetical protein
MEEVSLAFATGLLAAKQTEPAPLADSVCLKISEAKVLILNVVRTPVRWLLYFLSLGADWPPWLPWPGEVKPP